jgi:integrase
MAETGLRPESIDQLHTPTHYTRGASVLTLTDDTDKNRWGRELPLSARARAALDARLDTMTEEDEGLIFGPRRFVDSVKKAALVLVDEVPRAREVAPYDLRHALGTHALEASGNLLGVGYLLGHLQTTTTNKYAHPTRRAADAVMAAFRPPVSGEVLGEASQPSARRTVSFAPRSQAPGFVGAFLSCEGGDLNPYSLAATGT